MSNKFWLTLCYATAIFGFIWVGMTSWQVDGWRIAIELAPTGVGIFMLTFQRHQGWMKWGMYLIVAAWSGVVYVLFAGLAITNVWQGKPATDVMTAIVPFVFGAIPLIIIWGSRIGFAELSK
jgi:hypothetical protein